MIGLWITAWLLCGLLGVLILGRVEEVREITLSDLVPLCAAIAFGLATLLTAGSFWLEKFGGRIILYRRKK